jgi:general stress protein 26
MEEKELKQECLKLMEAAEAAYLSTIDSNGFPQIRVMANLRNKEQSPGLAEVFAKHGEDFLVYLTTCEQMPKVEQIKANPKASVYYCNVKESLGLMLAGQIEVITDENLKKELWQDWWETYYPDKKYALLRLLPDFAKGWNKEGPFGFEICAKK